MPKKTVIIIGAGRFGAETLKLARQIANHTAEFDILGLFDGGREAMEVSGFPSTGGCEGCSRNSGSPSQHEGCGRYWESKD